MGRFLLMVWLLGVALQSPAQYEMSLNHAIPDCKETMRTIVFPLADQANAVCRPEVYRSQSPFVQYALKRINRWRQFAKAKWDQEHQDIYQKQDGVMSPPLYPTYTYDQAIVYMYSEWDSECGKFNGRLSQSLIELRQLNPQCEDTLAYESFTRMWRDNGEVQKIYQEQSGRSTRGIASDTSELEY